VTEGRLRKEGVGNSRALEIVTQALLGSHRPMGYFQLRYKKLKNYYRGLCNSTEYKNIVAFMMYNSKYTSTQKRKITNALGKCTRNCFMLVLILQNGRRPLDLRSKKNQDQIAFADNE
jgi:hypothetical protein